VHPSARIIRYKLVDLSLVTIIFGSKETIHGVGEVRHEQENLYRTLAVAAAGIIWLVSVFFFPAVLAGLALLSVVLLMCHGHVRRKGMKRFEALQNGWRTCIIDCISEAAGEFHIATAPTLVVGGSLSQAFKRLFPHNGYLLLPSALILSPINNVSTKLMSDIIRYQLAHGALGQQGVWEEVFLLPARPIPFFYAAYRRVCDLSADRVVFLLSHKMKQSEGGSGQPNEETEFPPKSQSKKTQNSRPGPIGLFAGRAMHCLYSLHPTLYERLSEQSKYQARVERRERIYEVMRHRRAGIGPLSPPVNRFAAHSADLLNRMRSAIGWEKQKKYDGSHKIIRTGRRQGLTGPVVGVLFVCALVLFVTFTFERVHHVRTLWPGQETKTRHDAVGTPRVPGTPLEHQGEVVDPKPEGEIHGGSEPVQMEKNRRAVTRREGDRKNRRGISTIAQLANNALQDRGHKGIRAVVMRDGDIALIGSVSSTREKKLAFSAVQDYTNTRKIRDLVYVVEE
jgi:hypothetical protein